MAPKRITSKRGVTWEQDRWTFGDRAITVWLPIDAAPKNKRKPKAGKKKAPSKRTAASQSTEKPSARSKKRSKKASKSQAQLVLIG